MPGGDLYKLFLERSERLLLCTDLCQKCSRHDSSLHELPQLPHFPRISEEDKKMSGPKDSSLPDEFSASNNRMQSPGWSKMIE